MEKEIWKDVIGYEGLYQISNLGRIKSLFFNREKILKQNIGTSGYLFVGLHKNKKSKNHMIHQLMYESFYGIKSCRKFVIDHIDNNKTNNILSNLQYITNRLNSSKDKKSKTGHSNIYFNSNAYLVRMRINNVKKSVGTFKTIDEAIKYRDIYIENLEKMSLK